MGNAFEPEQRRPSVLVIDDDEMVASSIVGALEDDSDVTVAHSAEVAAGHLSTSWYDAIVCDLMMPGTSGIELYHRLRERDPKLARRMIFVTGGAFTTDTLRFLENTEQPYLEKPFGVDELCAVVERVAASDDSTAGRD